MPRNTVTLSDGSVWRLRDESLPRHELQDRGTNWMCMDRVDPTKPRSKHGYLFPWLIDTVTHDDPCCALRQLTAADHRAIAAVLDPTPHPDTARLDVLQSWYFAADFEYRIDDNVEMSALIFALPDGAKVGADLRKTIDAAQLNNRTSPHGSPASKAGAVVVDAARGTGEP